MRTRLSGAENARMRATAMVAGNMKLDKVRMVSCPPGASEKMGKEEDEIGLFYLSLFVCCPPRGWEGQLDHHSASRASNASLSLASASSSATMAAWCTAVLRIAS